ncbi:MAG: efflux transporter outer membrane subunit [Burkholderiaceae bacterium]|nr:efflux transporter outer membrane subunit [Burkholderiaceae bacterium]
MTMRPLLPPRPRLLAGAALAVATLAGCANLAPAYQRPALPVPGHYAMAPDAAAVAPPADWRAYFTDARLQALIEQALAHNGDLRIAVSRVAQARAAYGIEAAAQTPTVALQASAERGRVPADLNLTRHPLQARQYQAGVALASWELDFWGRVRNLGDAALANYLATDAARQAAQLALIGQVALTYLDLCDSAERIALARRTLASRQQSYDMAARRTRVGSASPLQLTQVETLLIQARALLLQLQQEHAARQHALALLVGAPVDADTGEGREAGAGATTPLAVPAPGLPSDLLARRPDIAAAEQRLLAAHANIGVARAAFFPRITLTGALGSASAQLDGLFDPGSRAWTFAPSIALPLFDAGRRRDQLALAEARRDEALASYDKTVQSAFRDVADALSAHHWLAAQRQVADDAVRVQRQRAHLSQLRFDSGASSYLDVLDAQRDLLSAEQQQVRARHAVQAARVSLYLALGGGATTQSHASTEPQS